MALPTLAEIEAELLKAAHADSYTTPVGGSVRRQSLKDLMAMHDWLQDKADRDENGMFSVAEVAQPT